jgi:hypothetical protein
LILQIFSHKDIYYVSNNTNQSTVFINEEYVHHKRM